MALNRMNFLQRGASGFTYRTMVQIAIGWAVLLALIYGVQLLRSMNIKRDIELAKMTMEQLNERKQQHLKRVELVSKRRMGMSTKETLADILQSAPKWSAVMRQLTTRLPPQVWLSAVRVDRTDVGESRVIIEGKADTQRELTNFILSLESSGKFAQTQLIGTKQATEGEGTLQYEIRTQPILSQF